jgi:glycosyltransferase involved in cell wall biosynthesis
LKERVLFVCSGNNGEIKPFIKEQADSLKKHNVKIDYFIIRGKGIFGYFKNIHLLKKQIKLLNIELIHAHYGLSGFLSIFQRGVPVVITFHGSDINIWWVKLFSSLASRLSAKSIFVSEKLANRLKVKNRVIIPCGIDIEMFKEIEKHSARKRLGLNSNKNIILFASYFNNKVKNYQLAKKAMELIDNDHQVIELKGYNREELNLLLNAADLLLLTSISEGSPQIIKEAMACNCPIVATDVGDIKEVISDTEGCYITSFNPEDVANKIKHVLGVKKRTNGRKNIMKLDIKKIAEKIIFIYEEILEKKLYKEVLDSQTPIFFNHQSQSH